MLNEEEKDVLRQLIDLDGLPVLLKVLEQHVQSIESSVIKSSSEDERSLIRLKCRAEGARKVFVDFARFLTEQRRS